MFNDPAYTTATARDKNDEPFVVGDEVLIRGKVTQINPVGEYTYIAVEAAEPAHGGALSFIYMLAHQVEKTGRPAVSSRQE